MDHFANAATDMNLSASAEIGAHDLADYRLGKLRLNLAPGRNPHGAKVRLSKACLAVEQRELQAWQVQGLDPLAKGHKALPSRLDVVESIADIVLR